MTHAQDSTTTRSGYNPAQVSGWVGWVLFAGVILMTTGFFNLLEGFVALFRDNFYVAGPEGLVLSMDFTVWGWLLILSGLLQIFAGYGVMKGRTWARITAIVLVVINALLHMAFMPAYPFWSVIVITLDVLVIYAVAVHGREAQAYNP
jgi:hypothetical protein